MAPSLRISGIPIQLPISSLVGVAALTWLFAPGFSDPARSGSSAYLLAAVFAVLTYATILVHELAHAGAARLFGFPVREIRLYALGGYTTYERRTASPGRELTIAIAGPAATLAIAALCAALARFSLAVAGDGALTELLSQLAYVGVLLGVYNLLPGLPLDGGALVKCPVWKASGSEALGTSIAAWAGLAIAVCVFAVPFVLAARLGLDGPDASSVVLVALFAGWLAMGALDALRRARAERRIPGIGAGRLARTPLLVAADLPLSSALEMRAQAGAARLVVADPSGRPIAVGDEAAIAAVPEHRRPWVSVGSVSRTLAADAVVTESLEGSELLSRLGEGSASDYLVVDDGGQLTGVLSVADVHAALTAP